ncbi:MAG: hypothetical protein WBI34_09870 [Tenuifilaceae bacterium]|jgi:hypothetical protein|nr:hypothetical protein [Bacteroidales bacterium]MDI9516628.1 hypothetical protein [Bacteroidota bacterium]NLH56047.1 hypothetical protein [Rikenellaceae bacterium]OQC63861.1 MAG: hypothetical protein BWX49_00994 [Bacteroidetes bacterium ADurb.Bin008]HNS31011.1 hypothetical protein [Tenuifilaceae bacterium]
MNILKISKSRARDYLAEKLASNVLNANLEDLVTVLRYNSIGGFEQLDDFDLFENLVAAFPELELVFLVESNENYLNISVKPLYIHDEEAILIDIRKLIQIIG